MLERPFGWQNGRTAFARAVRDAYSWSEGEVPGKVEDGCTGAGLVGSWGAIHGTHCTDSGSLPGADYRRSVTSRPPSRRSGRHKGPLPLLAQWGSAGVRPLHDKCRVCSHGGNNARAGLHRTTEDPYGWPEDEVPGKVKEGLILFRLPLAATGAERERGRPG
jgi:hypothetical protein